MMLPLSTQRPQASVAALQEAIRKGFESSGLGPCSVEAEGEETARLRRLQIDLTGAEVTRKFQLGARGDALPGKMAVEEFAIRGEPMRFEGAPFRFEMTGRQAEWSTRCYGGDEAILELRRIEEGKLTVEVAREEVDKLLLEAARAAAAKHGIEVTAAHLDLTVHDPRAFSFRAQLTCRVSIIRAPVEVTGEAEVDGDLSLRLSKLEVGGNAMAAGLAGKFARPFFERLQSGPIALGRFLPPGLKMRGIALSAGASLRLTAEFGGA